jgi:hypothetical protein
MWYPGRRSRFRISCAIGCSLIAVLIWTDARARAQRSGMFHGSADDPGINYMSGSLENPIDNLNKRLDAGAVRLTFQGRSGYLRSALEAIGLPIDSQLLVFSPASLQGRRISPANPRAIFFKDDVELGWVRDGDLIEVAAQDARQGIVFYTLPQKQVEAPRFQRATICLGCHISGDTSGVPGLLMFSSTPESDRAFASTVFTNHTLPLAKRFGGWFVTGALTPTSHQGNAVAALEGRSRALTSTEGLYDPDGYLSSSSDIAALMVFAHQAQTVNLMIHAGWEARAADPALHPGTPPANQALLAPLLRAVAEDVVDSLLFIDEARFDGRLQGASGFAERLAAEGPQDRKGRSLRQLALTGRLMRYPCSYLIYSPMFDALPPSIKSLIYERLWQVLSGAEKDARYRAALKLADRQAIVEILRDTKPGLPSYFKLVTR